MPVTDEKNRGGLLPKVEIVKTKLYAMVILLIGSQFSLHMGSLCCPSAMEASHVPQGAID